MTRDVNTEIPMECKHSSTLMIYLLTHVPIEPWWRDQQGETIPMFMN